ncbi:MAG: phage major capsid protein [Sphingomonadaceae bacterium]
MTLHSDRFRGLTSALAETDANKILAELTGAFETFKAKNEARVAVLEKALDDNAAALIGFKVGGAEGSPDPEAAKDERLAMGGFAKQGGDRPFRANAALSVGSDPDGGYTVFPTVSKVIQQKVFDASPLGRLARFENVAKGDAFVEPWDTSDLGAEWVGESQARPELDTPTLRMLEVPLHEIYTSQPVTQRLLDDSDFNLGAWLEGKISDKFARSEGAAYVNGNGILKPRGLLTYDISTDVDASRLWGEIQYLATGAAGAFPTSNPADKLIDLVHALRAPYRRNARWLMSTETVSVVRKFKSGDGAFLWRDGLMEGQPSTLLGYPVEVDEEMPAIAADSLSIAFGDYQRAYIVIGRPGLKLLRDPYTNKPNVIFYAYRRAGGALQNSEAVKLLKFAAS